MNAVDLALVLAVDGSASVTYEEFGLIAGGMAAALREPPIIAAPDRRPRQGQPMLAPAVVRYRRPGGHRRLDPDRLASRRPRLRRPVDNMPRIVRAGQTAIGEALLAALTLLRPHPGPRRPARW